MAFAIKRLPGRNAVGRCAVPTRNLEPAFAKASADETRNTPSHAWSVVRRMNPGTRLPTPVAWFGG